ncbi:MAG TPA: hypothetical protein VE338_06915 [Ktedonobacterales bacterium]|jgi:hypothetical protein|nr:hypothetical protein [Ktedonobacterales bacterium]
MAVEEIQLRFTGKLPLIMHSNRSVNTRDPLVREMKVLTGKRVKSDEDLDQIEFLEWQLGLYHDQNIGPYLPANLILACLRDAARKNKQGKLVIEGVWIDALKVPLDYDGPRDITGLYGDEQFVDIRPARVQSSTVNRTRPIFTRWSVQFTVAYDAEILNRDDLVRIAETAGQRIGMGDYRPTYGRFVVEVLNGKAR